MPAQASARKAKARSLTQYVRDKKRAVCPVCRLAPTIRSEMDGARTKKIRRAEILEWLAAEYGIKLTPAALDAHYSGRHERED